jgi:hypothetical protein
LPRVFHLLDLIADRLAVRDDGGRLNQVDHFVERRKLRREVAWRRFRLREQFNPNGADFVVLALSQQRLEFVHFDVQFDRSH